MKITVISSILVLLAILSFVPSMSHAFEPIALEGNEVIVKSHGLNSFTIIRYVKESRYCDRNTTRGIIFWKKERIDFGGAGTFAIPMDLSKAKSGESYCVIIVNQATGRKYRFDARVVNGQFVR